MKKMSIVLAAILAVAAIEAQAWTWEALSVAEMAANGGATHVLRFSHEDLTTTTTNTALAITNAILAGTALECVGMRMPVTFDGISTNYTTSLSLKVGDGSDDDLFLTATELCEDGTEVLVKWAPLASATVAYTSAVLTNVLYNSITGNVTVVTGVTSAGTVGELGRKLYASAGSLVATFTPNEEESLASFSRGEVVILFRAMRR
jgi:hypothetical protein